MDQLYKEMGIQDEDPPIEICRSTEENQPTLPTLDSSRVGSSMFCSYFFAFDDRTLTCASVATGTYM